MFDIRCPGQGVDWRASGGQSLDRLGFFKLKRSWRHGILAACTMSLVFASVQTSHAFDPKEVSGLLGADLDLERSTDDWPAVRLTRAYIPDSIDLSALMPRPVKQIHGSCVAYSVAYAVRGYYAALENNAKPGDDRFTPSPAFVHSRIRGKNKACQISGAHAKDALTYFLRAGAPTRKDVPDKAMCSPGVDRVGDFRTGRFAIQGAERIFQRKRTGPRARNADLDKMKLKLAAGHPIMVGFYLVEPRDFPGSKLVTLSYLQSDGIYKGSLGSNAGAPAGGHAMAFVGYDERRQAFLVQNSWGRDWAGSGFGWISYDATKADLGYAYTMRSRAKPPVPQPGVGPKSRDRITAAGPCSAVYVKGKQVDSSGKKTITTLEGFVETRAQLEALKRVDYPGVQFNIAVRPWPMCEALLTLEEPMAAPSRPHIEMLAGRDRFRFGDVMGFRVTSPEFFSYLYVVYLQADGTVVNLVPRQGPLRRQVPPGTILRFGDGRNGRQTYEAQPPAGSEAIFAIASRSPIAELEDLEDGQGGQFRLAAGIEGGEGASAEDRLYLSILRSGLAKMPDGKALRREVTADVVHLRIGQ